MNKSNYSHEYFQTSQGFKKVLEKVYSQILNYFRKRTVYRYFQAGRILEIGCGQGQFISQFEVQDWQRFVIEPYAKTQNLKSIKVFKTKLEKAKLVANYFDIITMWHVLEHLDRPKEGLKKIYQALKPTGVLILSTPNSDSLGARLTGKNWFHFDWRHHHQLFNEKQLRKLFSQAGFKLLNTKYLTWEYPFDLYHSLVRKLKPGWVLKPFLLVFSLISKPILVPFKEGETIMIVGKK